MPVALQAGKPGTARVDSYTFWKEINSEDFGEIPIILVKIPRHEHPIGFWGGCVQFQEGNRLITGASINNDVFYILRGEGESEAPYNTVHEVARRSVDATVTSVDFVATREVFTLIDYRNRNVMMRVDLVTSMVTDHGQPTSCTFSGTAELIRPR